MLSRMSSVGRGNAHSSDPAIRSGVGDRRHGLVPERTHRFSRRRLADEGRDLLTALDETVGRVHPTEDVLPQWSQRSTQRTMEPGAFLDVDVDDAETEVGFRVMLESCEQVRLAGTRLTLEQVQPAASVDDAFGMVPEDGVLTLAPDAGPRLAHRLRSGVAAPKRAATRMPVGHEQLRPTPGSVSFGILSGGPRGERGARRGRPRLSSSLTMRARQHCHGASGSPVQSSSRCGETPDPPSSPRHAADFRVRRRLRSRSSRARPNAVRACGSPSRSQESGPSRHRSSACSRRSNASSTCPTAVSDSASATSNRNRSASTVTELSSISTSPDLAAGTRWSGWSSPRARWSRDSRESMLRGER